VPRGEFTDSWTHAARVLFRDPEECHSERSVPSPGGTWKRKGAPLRWLGYLGRELERVVTLAQQLRDLERDGIVPRTVYPEIPPMVEYQLSKAGLALRPTRVPSGTRSRRAGPMHAAGSPAPFLGAFSTAQLCETPYFGSSNALRIFAVHTLYRW